MKSYTIKKAGADRLGCGYYQEETFRDTESNAYKLFDKRVAKAADTDTEFWLIESRRSVIAHAYT